jgi:hypothetical protein
VAQRLMIWVTECVPAGTAGATNRCDLQQVRFARFFAHTATRQSYLTRKRGAPYTLRSAPFPCCEISANVVLRSAAALHSVPRLARETQASSWRKETFRSFCPSTVHPQVLPSVAYPSKRKAGEATRGESSPP